jgi:N-methylhydantoinase A
VQRGHDPRDYTLVAFGGAGPLHAARLARELEIGHILVPPSPGILCAMGLLLTDLRGDFAVTRRVPLATGSLPQIAAGFAELGGRAEAWFAEERIAPAARRLARKADLRYAGQNYELPVPLPEGPLDAALIEALAAGFAAAHRRAYGFADEAAPVELVTLRLEALGLVEKAALRPAPDGGPDPAPALREERRVWLREAGGFVSCPVYDRDRLGAGNRIRGPAVVEQMDATTLVLPGMEARVDRYLNLVLEAR